jgi:hypothetical protein
MRTWEVNECDLGDVGRILYKAQPPLPVRFRWVPCRWRCDGSLPRYGRTRINSRLAQFTHSRNITTLGLGGPSLKRSDMKYSFLLREMHTPKETNKRGSAVNYSTDYQNNTQGCVDARWTSRKCGGGEGGTGHSSVDLYCNWSFNLPGGSHNQQRKSNETEHFQKRRKIEDKIAKRHQISPMGDLARKPL